jgi:putative hydrolase of the HAD superfamily
VTRAILFDLFNTLIASGDRRRAITLREMGATLGVEPEAFGQAFVRTWHERMVGTLGDLAEQCRTISRRIGGDPTDDQVSRAVELRLAFNRQTIVVADATLAALAATRAAGFQLAIVSNCTADSGTVLDETPLVAAVDAVVLSYRVGVAKPDTRIYEIACAAVDTPPTACLYVGDGADRELHGAKALGMRVYQTTQFAVTDPDWKGPRIGDIAELPGIVEQPA